MCDLCEHWRVAEILAAHQAATEHATRGKISTLMEIIALHCEALAQTCVWAPGQQEQELKNSGESVGDKGPFGLPKGTSNVMCAGLSPDEALEAAKGLNEALKQSVLCSSCGRLFAPVGVPAFVHGQVRKAWLRCPHCETMVEVETE